MSKEYNDYINQKVEQAIAQKNREQNPSQVRFDAELQMQVNNFIYRNTKQ